MRVVGSAPHDRGADIVGSIAAVGDYEEFTAEHPKPTGNGAVGEHGSAGAAGFCLYSSSFGVATARIQWLE
jgi:hypothetical protein